MNEATFIRRTLRLARKARGLTSPNPLVGAVLVKNGRIIGQGWHHRAGGPHAEIEALQDAAKHHRDVRGSTLFVTLEPCSTHGRTPPCTEAITAAGIRKVVVGTTDPNPKHAGRAFSILRRAGIQVVQLKSLDRALAAECESLNEAFNHWIVRRTPFVLVKSAMSLDGKIATVSGESKWITGPLSRKYAMELRRQSDAILVGINTVLADNPRLTVRPAKNGAIEIAPPRRRVILDSQARTPLSAHVVRDEFAPLTTIVVTRRAPRHRVAALSRRVRVLVAPHKKPKSKKQKMEINLRWLLKKLGLENVTSLLVEGGGEVNASFLLNRLAHRVAFFYAPKIIGGRDARKAVAGEGVRSVADMIRLTEVEWRRLGPDLLLTARLK